MPKATCKLKSVDLKSAKDQAKALLQQASTAVKRQPSCQVKLQTAEAAIKAADGLKGVEQRDALVRASFHAGQALACATVAGISPLPAKKSRKSKKSEVAS